MNERDIFHAALEIADAALRSAYLEKVCAGDAQLRQHVEAMLQVHPQLGAFLESPAADWEGAAKPTGRPFDTQGPAAELPGTTIGPYKILQQIGEGGFGIVYMAEQDKPVHRRVALKIIKPGMDSTQVIARFEAERQALAMMDHQNIAKVYDAGTTNAARPFFVMELVHGVPIIKYCDDNHLTVRERLELFVPVCKAIQHAHQKGIIHRDLKPTNILVCLYDGQPVPKVIDFGVAKAVEQRLTERTMFTQFGQIIGTFEYMSPEQAEMSQLGVDTRSDIYSLGVLLYELLTGTTPFSKERFKQSPYDEICRIIREEEPPKPSTRLSGSHDTLASISAQRHMEPAKLTRLVRGELDWIVMKALEKDRSRRYETASALAADVERYLKDEPVYAGPPGAGYRVRKFVRRNRGPVLAASLVLLALVGGVIGTSLGLRAAQRRLGQIEKANEILGSIFEDLNPEIGEKEGKELQVLLGERLDKATALIEGEAIGDPLAVARMQMTLGKSQLGLGNPEKAIRLLAQARTTLTAERGPDDPETLKCMNNLAGGYRYAAKFDLALPLFEEMLERRKARLGPDHPDTLESMHNLALGYREAEKFDLALPLFEETVQRRKAQLGPDDPNTLNSMNKLADAYRAAGKLEMALPLLEETLKRRKASLGPNHIDTLESMNDLALCYWSVGKLDLALPLSEETLELLKTKLGPDHPHTVRAMNNLALVYHDAGKLDLAVPLLEETVKRTKAKLSPDHPDTLLYICNLGRFYIQAGQTAKAEPLLRECLAGREKKEPDPWRTFDTKSLLGAALLGQKKYAEAEPLLLAGYEGLKERAAKIPMQYRKRLIEALERLVQLYEATGNKEKAKEWQKNLADAKAADQESGIRRQQSGNRRQQQQQ